MYHSWAQLRSLLLHFWGETAQREAVQPWQSVLPLPWHPTGKSFDPVICNINARTKYTHTVQVQGLLWWWGFLSKYANTLVNWLAQSWSKLTHSIDLRVLLSRKRQWSHLTMSIAQHNNEHTTKGRRTVKTVAGEEGEWCHGDQWIYLLFKNDISHFFFCSICLRTDVWRTYSWISSIASSPRNSLVCWKISSLRSQPAVSCASSGSQNDLHVTVTALSLLCRLHPFAGGGGVSLGLQTVGRVLAHRLAEHPALFLLQVFWLHNGEAASAAVLLAPHALR